MPRTEGDYVLSVTIRMLNSVHTKLKIEAAKRSISVSDLVAEALSQRTFEPIYPDNVAEAAMRKKPRA